MSGSAIVSRYPSLRKPAPITWTEVRAVVLADVQWTEATSKRLRESAYDEMRHLGRIDPWSVMHISSQWRPTIAGVPAPAWAHLYSARVQR